MIIIVCVKVVLDPEAPASLFKVDSEAKKVLPPKGTPPVLNPFDENAIECALKLKDSENASIIILSMGKSIPKPVIKKALATGAERLFLLEDESFEELDSYASAAVIAAGIKKIGDFDLILCGREAADSDAGQVGLGIAEKLGIPSISIAGKIKAIDRKLIVERVVSDGYETIEVTLPALATISSEAGNLRSATVAGMMAAQKKPVTIWKAADLGLNAQQLNRAKLFNLFQPVRETKCEIVAGATLEGAGANLAKKLKNNFL